MQKTSGVRLHFLRRIDERMKKELALFSAVLFLSATVFSQTKKELIDQNVQLRSSLDSLKKIADNQENIIESRDRTAKFHVDDITKLKAEKADLQAELKSKNRELKSLSEKLKFGNAKILTLTNRRAAIVVPEGRVWTLNSFIGDYFSGSHTDSSGNLIGTEIHIFIKAINGQVLTNVEAGKFGPQLFSSLHPNQSLRLPIVLGAKTAISIQIFEGELGNLKPYEGEIYCSVTDSKIR